MNVHYSVIIKGCPFNFMSSSFSLITASTLLIASIYDFLSTLIATFLPVYFSIARCTEPNDPYPTSFCKV
jgi:hypothetical protein